MSRRLWLVNLMLLALCGLAGWRLKATADEAKMAQERFLGIRVPARTPPAAAVPQPSPQVSPAAYLPVAQQLLVSGDRNPTVVVEAPPPPKPVPPLPRYHGVMALGGPPRIVLSEKDGGAQKSYALGETIGDFKLVAASQIGLVFEWEGKRIGARFEELKSKEAPPPQAAPAAAKPAAAVSNVTNTANVVSESERQNPGEAVNETTRACQNGDKSPAGTIKDGFRKVLRATPFGSQCYWERVQ